MLWMTEFLVGNLVRDVLEDSIARLTYLAQLLILPIQISARDSIFFSRNNARNSVFWRTSWTDASISRSLALMRQPLNLRKVAIFFNSLSSRK